MNFVLKNYLVFAVLALGIACYIANREGTKLGKEAGNKKCLQKENSK